MLVNISFATMQNPLKQDPYIENIIQNLPENTETVYKNDSLTYYYKIYKTSEYTTINKIYIDNVKKYEIKYLTYGSFITYDQVIFIYDKDLNLINKVLLQNFNKLFEYLARNPIILKLYTVSYTLNTNNYLVTATKIDIKKDNEFYKYQIFLLPNKFYISKGINQKIYLFDLFDK
ncbi:hypothetical protein LF845_06225 [Deferribacterales bacterium Es71-Z0220]|uniref:hypothetical protein n=1 Tax=Deferrivibrio essentukiensis TaxID=2880922 RepID=UPI001F600A61|nr:hypothetical protein [Deferrivibrio essentukiensis]MCB4204552.1 hypothetical protein [Deferrivibrio essentukiensis]